MNDDAAGQPEDDQDGQPSERPASAVISTEEPEDDLLARVPVSAAGEPSGPGTAAPGSQVDGDESGAGVEVPGGGIDPPLGAT